MAGRFLTQKLSSQMSRSISLVAAGPASECGNGILSKLSHGPAVHPSLAVPSNRGIRGYEGGIKTLCNLFHGGAVHPGMGVPSNHGIHGYAAMYFNTFPCFCASGVKRYFSSNASTRRGVCTKAKWAAGKVQPTATQVESASKMLILVIP